MTEISRRAVMRAGAATVVLAPLATANEAAAAGRTANLYARSRFSPLVNATFTLVSPTTTTRLTLTTVADLPGAPPLDEDRFVLTFQCPAGGPPQGTYSLRRAGFTATPMFVVPSDASRRTHQVIVNRPS